MRLIKHKLVRLLLVAVVALSVPLSFAPGSASAASQCGKGDDAVKTAINFGCKGSSCARSNCSAIIDIMFAIIRFLSNGVGIFIVGSIVLAGVQYTTARSDPSAVEAAQNRIRSSVIALLIFIFAYAILNYVIPSGFFRG